MLGVRVRHRDRLYFNSMVTVVKKMVEVLLVES